MKYKLLCCMDLIAVILELTSSVTSALLRTAETHSRKDEWREKEAAWRRFP